MTEGGLVIAFRVDASIDIGTGHVMRCLTLADALSSDGAACHFLCRDLPGHLASLIQQRGHNIHLLPRAEETADDQTTAHSAWLTVTQAEDARQSKAFIEDNRPDWLIVDHYALDREWEASARKPGARLMVIDDLADRPHICEVLLDQNLGRRLADYDGLVGSDCSRLIGPRYALLRPEFAERRKESLVRRCEGRLERILVSMGGVDKDNLTARMLDTLSGMDLPEAVRIEVVMGPNAPHFEDVREQAATMPVPTNILRAVNDMAALMAKSDLAIGAAGTTSWERCCLGLPTVLVTMAANQVEAAAELETAGAVLLAGDIRAPTLAFQVRDAVTWLCTPERLAEVAKNAARLVDGEGARRVCNVVALRAYKVRDAIVADAEKIYTWRYSGTSASYYRNSVVPEYDDHLVWIEKAVDAGRRLLMVAWDEEDIGHVRFDPAKSEPGAELVSICIAPEARGQGHAERVLRAAMLHATGLGAENFIAEVHPDNAASCRLFERLGFREAGSDEGFRQYAISSDAVLDGR